MPLPSGSSFRYISPMVFSSSVVAISTENTCTPDLVTISSGWTLAARAPKPANQASAATTTANSPTRHRQRYRPEFMETGSANPVDFSRLTLTRRSPQMPEPTAQPGPARLTIPSGEACGPKLAVQCEDSADGPVSG